MTDLPACAGKEPFPRRTDALRFLAMKARRAPFRWGAAQVYRCDGCGQHHIGHSSFRVLKTAPASRMRYALDMEEDDE